MGFDIRIPIGALLAAIGALLAAHGLLAGPAVGGHTMGINLNLWWGVLMLVVGATFLLLARRRQ